MAATLVQSKTYSSSANNTSHSITFDSAPTQNNLLLLALVSDATASTPSGWSLATSSVDFTGTYLFYRIAPSGLSATVTVTVGGSTSCTLIGLEYSGIDTASPLDKTASAAHGSVNTVNTGTTATTAQADELLVGLAGFQVSGGSPTVTGWSNSFVQQGSTSSTASAQNIGSALATRIVSATGAYSSAASLSVANNHPSGLIGTFKIAAGGTDVTVTPAAITGTFALQSSTVSTTSSVTVSPTALTGTFAVPAPTVSTTASVTVSPSTVTGTFSVPSASVSLGGAVNVTPSPVAATFSTTSSTLLLDNTFAVSRVTGTFAVRNPSVNTGQPSTFSNKLRNLAIHIGLRL